MGCYRERSIGAMMYIWNKKGQIKLGPDNFVTPKVGQELKPGLVEMIPKKTLEGMIAEKRIIDGSAKKEANDKVKATQDEAIAKAQAQNAKNKAVKALVDELAKMEMDGAPANKIKAQKKKIKEAKKKKIKEAKK
jgi:hypothetical protein